MRPTGAGISALWLRLTLLCNVPLHRKA